MFSKLMPIIITDVVRYREISDPLSLMFLAVAGPTAEKFMTQGQVAGSEANSGSSSQRKSLTSAMSSSLLKKKIALINFILPSFLPIKGIIKDFILDEKMESGLTQS